MSAITVTNLTFAYDGSYNNIFDDVSFVIDSEWRLGFTGRNGRGKTTFLNLLMGKHEYSGHISAHVDFEYFPYDVPDKSIDTIQVVMNIGTDFELWELIRELSLLNVDECVLYRPFDTLSNGEQAKVLLTAMFLKPNSFLLIDEPTNHLDIYARAALSKYLQSKAGFVLVSHDRAFLDNCIDHVLSINKTHIDISQGNFSTWQKNKAMQDNCEIAENDRLKKDMRRLSASAKRASAWSDKTENSKIGTHASDRGFIGHKSAKMMKRAKGIEARHNTAIIEKSNLMKNIESAEALKISPLVYPGGKLVTLSNASAYYDNRAVVSNVTLGICNGNRIAVCGRNGSGKSSLISLICGHNIESAGDIWRGSDLVISHVSQNTDFLNGSLADFARQHSIDESLFKAILRKMDFSRTQFEKNMQDFSGGQKKKVLIAKSLCEPAHLYVWDEPLNFIDVLSRIQIEELILQHCPTMVFVEHDRAFTDRIATKRIEL